MGGRRFRQVNLSILALLWLQGLECAVEGGEELANAALKLTKGFVGALVWRLMSERGGEVSGGEDGVLAVAAHADVDTDVVRIGGGLFCCFLR
jgi:hypothetical protein